MGALSGPLEWGVMPSPMGTFSTSHCSVYSLLSSLLPSRRFGGHEVPHQIPDLVFLATSPILSHLLGINSGVIKGGHYENQEMPVIWAVSGFRSSVLRTGPAMSDHPALCSAPLLWAFKPTVWTCALEFFSYTHPLSAPGPCGPSPPSPPSPPDARPQ